MILANVRMDETSTPDLVKRCLAGDASAWNSLIERYGRLVYSIPRGYGLKEFDADDVFQNVFELLLRQLAAVRDPKRLSAWLITTTHRECWRIARCRNRRWRLPIDLIDPLETAPEAASRREEHAIVHQALSCLTNRERKLMETLFLEPAEIDYGAIAERLGMKRGSIGPTRARCFRKLERILTGMGYEGENATQRTSFTARIPSSSNLLTNAVLN